MTRRRTLALAALAVAWAASCADNWEPPPPDLRTRNAAVEAAIEEIEVARTAPLDDVAALLDSSDWRVKRAAALRLADFADDAKPYVPKLIEALDDEMPRVRTAACRALGAIGDSRSIDPLVATLVDGDERVRTWGWKALVKIGEPAHPRLVYYLGKEAPELPAFELENGEAVDVRDELRRLMPDLGKESIPALIEGLGDSDSFRNVNSATVLKHMGKDAAQAVPDIIERLEKSSYTALKVLCVQVLQAMGDIDPLIVPALRKAKDDPDKKVAAKARAALRDIEKKAAKAAAEKKRKRAKRKNKRKKKSNGGE